MSTNDPEGVAERITQMRVLTQEAVDTTATAYTADASVDVEKRLGEEMRRRGFDADDAWLADVAQRIRSGHHVAFDEEPDSAGG